LVQSFDWEGLLAIHGKIPVGKQIFLMNFDPGDD